MTETLALLAASCGLLVASVLFVRWVEAARRRRELVAFELHFPREVEPAAVTAFIVSLSGLLLPRWKRLFSSSAAVFEATSTAAGIRHHLLVPESNRSLVMAQLSAVLPQAAAVIDPTHRIVRPRLAVELGMSSTGRPLSVEHPEAVSRALLASYQPLDTGEAITVQWIVAPHPPVSPIKSASSAASAKRKAGQIGEWAVPLPDSEAIRAARSKQASPLFLAVGRIGVAGPTLERQRSIVRRALGALHVTNAPGVHFRHRGLPSAVVSDRMVRRAWPLVDFPGVLNAGELTAMIAWPLGSAPVAGLSRPRHRSLPPASTMATTGRVLAQATYPGQERPLALAVRDALHHVWICGPTGVGKTTAVGCLVCQDLEAGRAVVVIDPKGDLARDVLDRVPVGREHDVILIDPTDDQRPVGLNLLAGAQRNPELVADQVLGIFHRLYKAFWGPRTQDVLHSALLTLAQEPGTTLVDVPLLLINDTFRRRVVGRVDDFVLQQFWAAYEAMSPGERAQAIGPVMNKLRQFLLRPRLRAVIGQAEPTFTLEEVLNDRKILIVALPAGLIGEEAAALIGSLVVARLWQAIQSRAALPPELRAPAFVFLDEFQSFVQPGTDLGAVLAQSRGLGVGFTLAHQHLGQLPVELRQAVAANARSKVVFQTAAGDAAAMARELGSPVEASDLISLPAYEVVAALTAEGQVAPPVSGRTFPLPPPTGRGETARAASRARYGRDRAEVDAAIRARQDGPRPDGPTLRRKRGQS